MLYQQSSTEVGFQHNRSHALTRATHLQFRKQMSVLKKRKMSIKYYQSYVIHLHKSPSTLSLFLVVPEIGRNTEQIGKSSRHFEGPGSKHSFPDSFETDTTGVQLFPTSAWSRARDYRTGNPHNLFSLSRGTANSELKILYNRSKYTTCQAKGRQFTAGKVTQRLFSFDTCTYLAIYRYR